MKKKVITDDSDEAEEEGGSNISDNEQKMSRIAQSVKGKDRRVRTPKKFDDDFLDSGDQQRSRPQRPSQKVQTPIKTNKRSAKRTSRVITDSSTSSSSDGDDVSSSSDESASSASDSNSSDSSSDESASVSSGSSSASESESESGNESDSDDESTAPKRRGGKSVQTGKRPVTNKGKIQAKMKKQPQQKNLSPQATPKRNLRNLPKKKYSKDYEYEYDDDEEEEEEMSEEDSDEISLGSEDTESEESPSQSSSDGGDDDNAYDDEEEHTNNSKDKNKSKTISEDDEIEPPSLSASSSDNESNSEEEEEEENSSESNSDDSEEEDDDDDDDDDEDSDDNYGEKSRKRKTPTRGKGRTNRVQNSKGKSSRVPSGSSQKKGRRAKQKDPVSNFIIPPQHYTEIPLKLEKALAWKYAETRNEEDDDDDDIEDEEMLIFVKWKDISYQHCEWVFKSAFDEDKLARQRINLMIKRRNGCFAYPPLPAGGENPTVAALAEEDDGHVAPEVLEPERILLSYRVTREEDEKVHAIVQTKLRQRELKKEQKRMKEQEQKGENREEKSESDVTVKDEDDDDDDDSGDLNDSENESMLAEDEDIENVPLYLVKWKGLGYVNATWETRRDLAIAVGVSEANDLIHEYWERSKVPPASTWKEPPSPKVRGKGRAWKAISEVPDGFFGPGNTLRPYQLEGLNWLVYCWRNGTNSILADEMGLGKTAQTVATMQWLHAREGVKGPFLVIAPLSTLGHWKREAENWTQLRTIVYHGSAQEKNIIRACEWAYPANPNGPPYKFDLLITTYETIRSDRALLCGVKWAYAAFDEAHRLKNSASKVLADVKALQLEQILLLTGTPIQNDTSELWTLLNLLDPVEFASRDDFMAEFGELRDATQVSALHDILKPYLLRRMKENVEATLSAKEETLIEVELTVLQKQYYRAIYEHNIAFLRKGCKGSAAPSLINVVMELRKCCNHPYLIKGVEQAATAGLKDEAAIHRQLVAASGKLVLIDKLLPKLKADGHQVLIFSQMVRVLDILEDYLSFCGYQFERLDGRIRGSDRQAAIDRFCKPGSDRFVFLLCTRAGGLGINLQVADTVIIFDSDWNPQNDVQAQARCHRIGQKKDVKVYRLITHGTYEKYMFDTASRKLGLDQAVLTKFEQSTSPFRDADSAATSPSPVSGDAQGLVPQAGGITLRQMSTKQIDSLLKHGAYGIMESDDAAKKFVEADIDQILQGATTIVHNSEGGGSGGSTFSKASFVSDQSAPDIDIDDPDFWEKLMPEVETRNPLIMTEPRERHPVDHFSLTQVDMDDSSSSDDDGEEETDDTSATAAAAAAEDDDKPGVAGHKVKKIRHWNGAEKQRFRTWLVYLGWGRWARLKESAKLTKWSAEEVESFAKAFLCKLLACIEDKDKRGKYVASVTCLNPVDIEGWDSEDFVLRSEDLDAAPELHLPDYINDTATFPTFGSTPTESPAPVPAETNAEEESQQSPAPSEMVVEEANEVKQEPTTPITESLTDTNAENKVSPSKPASQDGTKSLKLRFVFSKTEEENNTSDTTINNAPSQQEQQLPLTHESEKEEATSDANQKSQDENQQPLNEIKVEGDELEEKPEANKYLNVRRFDDEEELNSDSFNEYAKKNALKLLSRLSLGSQLNRIVERSPNRDFLTGLPDINDRICKWWTSQDDTDIIVGSVKWGLSRYDQIRSDPELRFLNDFGPPTPAASHTPEDIDEEKQPSELNPDENELQSVGNDDNKKDDMEVENQPAQTSQQEDEEIGEAKDDGSTVSSNNEDGKHVWPSNRELTKYIKRLYRHILNCEKIRLRQQAKAEKKAKQQEERDKKKALINAEWSKRERTDLVRILSTFGIPVDENGETDIDLLRERARLSKKTPENVRSFLNTFLSRCDQVIQDTIAASKAQVDAAAAKTAKMTISFVENAASTTSPSSSSSVPPEPNSLAEKQPEGVDQALEQKPAETQEVKGENEGAKEEEQQGIAQVQQQATEEEQEAVTQLTKDIGYATCKRVIQRINLFKDLRKYLLSLSDDDLGIVLASSKRSQAMPKWWDPRVHDVSLIKGVVKHGFSKWDDIIEDPELSFYPIMIEHREKKKLDQKASTKNEEEEKGDVAPEERHQVDVKKEDQQVADEKVDDDNEKKADNANEEGGEGEKKAENANEEGGEGEKKPDITLAQLIGLPRDIQLLHRLESLITLGKQAEDIIHKANEKKAKKSRGSKSSAKTKRVTKKSSTETGEAPDGDTDKKKTTKKQRRKKVSEKDKLLNDAKSMGGLITGTTEEKEDGKEGEGGGSAKPSTKRSRRKKSVNTGDEDGEYVAKKTSHSEQSGDKSAAPKRRSSRKRKSVEHYSDESGSEKPPRAKSSETQEKRRREPKSRAKERTKKESSTATADENGQQLQLPSLPEQPGEGDEISKQTQELAPPPAKKPRKKRTPKPKPEPIDTLLPSVDMLLKEDDQQQQQQQQQPPKQKRHRRTKAEMEKFRSELEKEKAEKASNSEPKQKKPRKPREKKERPERGEGEKPPRKKKNTGNASEFPDTLDITGMSGTGYQQLSSMLTSQIEPPSASGEPTVISADSQQFSLPFDIMGKEMVSPLLQQQQSSSSSSHSHHHHRTLDKNGQPVKHKHHKKHSERHSERHSEKKRKKKDDDIIDPTAISLEIKPSGQPFILGIQPQTNPSMVAGPSSISILPYGKQDIASQQQSLQIQASENGAGLFIPGKGYNNGAINNIAVGREHEKEPRKKERGRRTETRITEFGNPIFAPFFYKNVVVYADGFKSERMHQSYKDPKTKCRYFMSIKAENSRPTFTVSCEDDPGNAFKSSNISECFDALNNSLMEASKMNGCAPKIISKSRYEDFFGLTSKEMIEHNNRAAMAQKSADNPNLVEYMKSLHHYHQRCNGKTSKTKQHSAKQEAQVQQDPQNVPRKLPSIQMYIPFAQQQSQIKAQSLSYPTPNTVMPHQFPPPPPPPVQQHPPALIPTPAQARPLQVKVHSFGQQQLQLPPQIQHRLPQMQPPFVYNNQSQTTRPHFLPPLKQALTQQYTQSGQQMFLSPTLRQPQPLQPLRQQQQQQQPQYQAPLHQNTQMHPPPQTLNILPPINILTQQQPQQQSVQLPDSQTIWDFNRPV